jgi:hypothetical protein
VPIDASPRPAATADAEPLLDVPGLFCISQALRHPTGPLESRPIKVVRMPLVPTTSLRV